MKMLKFAVPGLAVAALAAGAAPVAVNAAEVTLRGASCFPIGSPPGRPFEALVKEMNAKGKGVVQVNLLGGAPAIGSPFTLTQRMAKGAYDMVGCTEAYFGNVLPEAPVLRLQEYDFATLRKRGAIAYVSKLLAAKNLHYVGRYWDYGTFHLFLSKPITGPDLKGLHLRVAPVYTAFFKALGATVQLAAMPKIYTLMESNTVQGFGWPAVGWNPAWAKVTKYRVDPGFYNASLHLLVNNRKWKSLSDAQRKFITDLTLAHESAAETTKPRFQALRKKTMAWYESKGIKTIEMKGADREKWLGTAKKAAWDEVLKRSPEHGKKLMELFTK
ncbi:MAG: ABC transporter substrate-binding protein [Rhodospirillaceae bacterium]|nr:ABC transporter substrate-binding protein [Rhodospirillaceae bacterium]MYB14629.1 ABC transporter substrate-binding protein [Rhodospirillaceae bacterium]MYI50010.1 ABC transporter substrate-binding protein [Rhodospirillaceae bacterium]